MALAVFCRPEPCLALFAPPYEEFQTIDASWAAPSLPPRGLALIWWLVDGRLQEEEFQRLYDRPPGLGLVIVLPPARELARALPLLSYLTALEAKAVLPTGRINSPARVREVLSLAPTQLAPAVTQYLVRRHLLRSDEMRRQVARILELAPEVGSISKLARRLHTSRRTLGRHFAAAGLPVPSHWLQFARLMHVAVRLQRDPAAVFRAAARCGYPDGFTMSNQMKRLVDCRPSEVRTHIGWEWIVECWIRKEARAGGIDGVRYRDAVAVYLAEADRADGGSGAVAPGQATPEQSAPSAVVRNESETEALACAPV